MLKSDQLSTSTKNRKKHKSPNNPLRTCVVKVTCGSRITPVNINITRMSYRAYIEPVADCLEIYALLAKML